MTSLGTLATIATVVVGGLMALQLTAIGIEHARRTRAQARDTRTAAELTPLLLALLDSAGDDPAALAPDVAQAPEILDELVLTLLSQLRGKDRRTLQQVLVARGVVDRAAVDLTAGAAWRRGRAAALIGAAGSAGHIGALTALLRDRSADVRCSAARALGRTGAPAAAPALLAALCTDPVVPSGVVGMALLDLGTPALPALRKALVDAPVPARGLAATLVGLHGDITTVADLEALLHDREQPVSVRCAAADALGRIGSPQATATLVEVLGTEPFEALRRDAAEALGRIGDPAALDVLSAGLAGPDLEVRTTCGEALAALGAEGRARLAKLADADDEAVGAARAARAALDALGAAPRRVQVVP